MPRDLCPAVPFPAGNPYGGSNGVSDAPTTTSPTAQPPRSPSSTLNIVAVTVGVTVGLVLLIVGGILVYGHRRYGWFKSRHLEDGNGKFVKMQDDFGARAAKLERGDSNSTL